MYGSIPLSNAVPSDLSSDSQAFILNCAKAARLFQRWAITLELPSVSLIPHHIACITALERSLSSLEEKKDAVPANDGIIVVVDLPSSTANVSLVSSSVCFLCISSPLARLLQVARNPETSSSCRRGDYQFFVRLCDEHSFFLSLTPRGSLPQVGK